MMAIADDLSKTKKTTKKTTSKTGSNAPVFDPLTGVTSVPSAPAAAKAPAAPSPILDYATAIGSGRSMGDVQSTTPASSTTGAAAGESGGSTTGSGATGGGSNNSNTAGGIDPSVQAYINSLSAKSAADAAALAAQAQTERVSAFNILKTEFDKYGLGSLVDGIKGLLTDGTPAAEFALKLRETPQYQARFSANADRIKSGLAALSPAEYVAMEDQYQNLMRNYGLPSAYYAQTVDPVTGIKKQTGFDKLLANDVSAVELEDRISTAQQRVLNSNPEVLQALRQFYPDLNNADILAYALDPQNALSNIKRKVSAAEIGGAALAQGLQLQGGTAESLAGMGITKAQAQQGYTDVAGMVPRGSALASIYGEPAYTQSTAEAEVFNTAGAAEAAKKRKKLTALEQASFSGSSGVGALNRDRAVSNYMLGQPGAGSY